MRSMLLLGPDRRMDAAVDRRVLGRQAERVEAHREHDVQPCMRRMRATMSGPRGRIPVPDVQVAGRVRVHGQQVVLLRAGRRRRRGTARRRPIARASLPRTRAGRSARRGRCGPGAGPCRHASLPAALGDPAVNAIGNVKTGGRTLGRGGPAAPLGRAEAPPGGRLRAPHVRGGECHADEASASWAGRASSSGQSGAGRSHGMSRHRSGGWSAGPSLPPAWRYLSAGYIAVCRAAARHSRPGTANCSRRARSRTGPGRRRLQDAGHLGQRPRSCRTSGTPGPRSTRSAEAGSRPVASASPDRRDHRGRLAARPRSTSSIGLPGSTAVTRQPQLRHRQLARPVPAPRSTTSVAAGASGVGDASNSSSG